MNWLGKLALILSARRRGSRISFKAYLKEAGRIRVGGRTKVHAHASIDASRGGGVTLGDRVTLNRYAMVQGSDGGVFIGDGTEINNFAFLNGAGVLTIGRNVLIGPGAKIVSSQHRFDDPALPIREQDNLFRETRIDDGAWIGAGAVIMAGVHVGADAIVGATAVLTHSCPRGAIMLGVPARLTRYRPGFGPDDTAAS